MISVPEYNANVVIGGENFPERRWHAHAIAAGQLPPDVRHFDKMRE
jgi:hypothetical protein